MKSLVVDDAKVVRVTLCRIMKQLGYETFEAADGQQAMDVVQGVQDIDVVLLDWNMPVMNGYDFLVALRADQTLTRQPRVIMVTTETSMPHMLKAISAGADEYIMKPFDQEMVQGKLAMVGLGDDNN